MQLKSKCKMLSGWEVEYITKLPMESYRRADGSTGQDAQWDDAEYSYRDFATEAAAMRFAKSVVVGLPVECAWVKRFKMEPISERYQDCLDREYVGDAVEVSS